MQVASLELSKELYELSGWVPEEWQYELTDEHPEPEYDLGYLIRKLPPYVEQDIYAGYLSLDAGSRDWRCGYKDESGVFVIGDASWTDTPENALCKLAIALAKAGILTKEENGK